MKNYLLALPKEAGKVTGHNVFPVGIAYVSAYLKQQGHRVFTANLEFFKETTEVAMRRLITEHDIDVLGTSGLSRDYPRIKALIDAARSVKPDIVVVVGGGIISGDAVPAMIALGADIGVIGQGEITMHELATALNRGESYTDIPGLVFKSGDRYVITAPRKDIKNLDRLPFPDYDGFAYDEFMRQINHQVAYVTASRSCPFKCTFCFHPSGDRYRQRSLDNIFREIDYLLATYGNFRALSISDELFAPKRNRVVEFCHRIAPYKIDWGVQLRVCDVDEEMLRLMRDSGCNSISYGIESGDDTILASMKKKITLAQIERALKWTYEVGIDIQGGLIFGDAEETVETAGNTLKWNDEHAHYALDLNMIHIFPGTPLYTNAMLKGILKDPVKFLTDGCPLINVSKLTDQEYKDLSSNLYERNMRAKYEPHVYDVQKIGNDTCIVDVVCDKCGTVTRVHADAMHVTKISCTGCRQRYYLDVFKRLSLPEDLPDRNFSHDGYVALWGAGELCIKFLDNYPILQDDRFIVVDSSKSRQGYSVCGKYIYPPSYLTANSVETAVITVTRRKNEILRQLTAYPTVKNIYLPQVEILGDDRALFKLEQIEVLMEASQV